MIKKIAIQRSSFERYFMEADGEDDTKVSVTVAPRKNRGTDYGSEEDGTNVTVAPRANRGTDYGADDDDGNEDEAPTDEPDGGKEDTPGGPDTGDDGSDYTDDGDGEDDDGAAADDTTGDEDADDGPDTGDDGTDYTDDGDDGEEGDGGEEDGDGDDADNKPSEEDIKKYNMYRRYLRLYRVIESIIEKIRDVVKNDAAKNAVIKRVTSTLTDLNQNMFDFMTVKYSTASYVAIKVYFETVIATVRLNFELLKNNRINLNNHQ